MCYNKYWCEGAQKSLNEQQVVARKPSTIRTVGFEISKIENANILFFSHKSWKLLTKNKYGLVFNENIPLSSYYWQGLATL